MNLVQIQIKISACSIEVNDILFFAAHSNENLQKKETNMTATSHSRNNVSVTLDN